MSDQTAARIAALIEKALPDESTTLVVGSAGNGSMVLHTIRPKPIDLLQIARSLIEQAAENWHTERGPSRSVAEGSAAICEAVLTQIDRIPGMDDDATDDDD